MGDQQHAPRSRVAMNVVCLIGHHTTFGQVGGTRSSSERPAGRLRAPVTLSAPRRPDFARSAAVCRPSSRRAISSPSSPVSITACSSRSIRSRRRGPTGIGAPKAAFHRNHAAPVDAAPAGRWRIGRVMPADPVGDGAPCSLREWMAMSAASGAARAVPSIARAYTVRRSMGPAPSASSGSQNACRCSVTGVARRRRGQTAPPGCRAARDSLAIWKPPAPAPRANAALIGVLAWARSELESVPAAAATAATPAHRGAPPHPPAAAAA